MKRQKPAAREKKYKFTATVVCVLLISLILPSAVNLLARDTLSGIQEQMEEIAEREDAAYRVLEIVPDRSLARVGYYFGGQEPFLVHDDDGSVLFDAWDETDKEWKPWQSGLEQFGNRDDREYYVNHLMERILQEEGIKDLVTVSGNIVTVSGNSIATISGNTPVLSVTAAPAPAAPGEAEQGDGLADAPLLLSTYREVTAEQYADSPGEYGKYETEAGERKGYFKHIDTESYDGTRYDVHFVHYGELQPGAAGGFYQVTGETLIPETLDSSWDTLLNENAYVKEGDRYVYCGKVADVGTVEEESDSSLPAGITVDEDKLLEDGLEKKEEDLTGGGNGAGTGGEGGENDGKGNGVNGESGSTSGGSGTGSGAQNDPDGSGTGSGADNGAGGDSGTGGGSGSGQEGTAAEGADSTGGAGQDAAGGAGESARLSGSGEWQLFSAPADTEYYYLKMERVASPVAGQTYYKAEYELSDTGSYGCEFTADDDGFADTINASALTVYYEGGIQNLEWFKRYACDMEETVFGSFDVEVTTLTVGELNNNMIDKNFSLDNFDFFSICDGEYKEESGNTKLGFADGNDLDFSTAQKLFDSIMTKKKPTVIDSSIVFSKEALKAEDKLNTDMKQKKPNLWKLAALLCQQSPDRFLPEKGTDETRPAFTWEGNPAVNWVDIEKGMGFPEDTDNNYVNQNVYSLYQSSFVNPDFEKKAINDTSLDISVSDANMEGFEDVLLEIESENMYREADAAWEGELLSTQIKQSGIVRYILNYAFQRATYLKTKINILDIEPCYPDEDSFPLTKKDVKKWIAEDSPITEDDITITTMAVSEFIGKNEDLNETWDLIYIGTDVDKLNTDEDGRTVFNDESMNGMTYFHVGDYRYASAMLGGILNTEYGTEYDKSGNKVSENRLYDFIKVRYSGLDITGNKMKDLISYADASYPIVLSDDFYTKDADGNTVIDGEYIDNSSYMYEFAQKMLKDKRKNVFSRKLLGGGEDGGKANVRLFSFYLNRPKLELVDTRVESASMGDNGVYNIDEKDGHYTLEYRFTISNIGAVSMDTRYQCELYIDVNSDGKFSPLEKMEDISVSGAEDAAPDNLRAGVSYTLRRQVPDGYRGVLSWKVKVSQVNNGNIRAAMTGYSKTAGMEPETIHVLQICRDEFWWEGAADNPWLSSGGWWKQENNRRMDLEREFSDPDSNYYKLLNGGEINGKPYQGIRDDFDIDVKCVTVSEFEKLYAEAEDKQSVLRDYNMLILGFSDCYGNLTEKTINGPGGITEFIDSGKSVLFAHDTTSFINFDYGNYGYPNNSFDQSTYGVVNYRTSNNRISNYSYGRYGTDFPWSYQLNRFVRPLVGMDRYGVNELSIGKNENGEVTDVKNTARSNLLRQGNDLKEGDAGWDMLQRASHDIAWRPGTDRKEAVPEVQGFTYTIIGLKDRDRSGDLSWPKVSRKEGTVKNGLLNYDFGGYLGKKQLADGSGDSEMNATMVNEGQITTYPFKLEGTLAVSKTHGQYYQLDMDADDDNDGESDLVVWYCLGENSDDSPNMYSVSPNDVVNNYYIYNKGNITYTGMGHWGRASAYPKYVEEAKLFINTIISAYSASIKPSEVKIIDEKTQEKINDIYNYFDVKNDKHLDGEFADYQKVYFTVRDTNFVKGTRKLSAAFYLEAADGDISLTLHGENYKVNRLMGLTVYAGDKDGDDGNDAVVDAASLTSGGIYYVRIPRELYEEGKTRQSLFIESKSRINRYNEEIVTTPVFDKVDMVKLQLFELD